MTETLPADVAINAWAGTAARGHLEAKANRWGAKGGLPASQQALALGTPADPTD